MLPPAALLARSVLRPAARPGPGPRGLRSGPALSPDTVLGLAAVFVSIFGPAAWVLAHIQDYRKREE
uniref:COX8A oxidase n=1 Tax=Taeniopygia guttata TaxID=59729 RepID=A0A674H8C8_TAEGU